MDVRGPQGMIIRLGDGAGSRVGRMITGSRSVEFGSVRELTTALGGHVPLRAIAAAAVASLVIGVGLVGLGGGCAEPPAGLTTRLTGGAAALPSRTILRRDGPFSIAGAGHAILLGEVNNPHDRASAFVGDGNGDGLPFDFPPQARSSAEVPWEARGSDAVQCSASSELSPGSLIVHTRTSLPSGPRSF